MRGAVAWALGVVLFVSGVSGVSGACRPAGAPEPAADAGVGATTDPEIAAGNFEAQLRGFERVLERSSDVETVAKVAAMRLLRAQFFSRVSDYDRAIELAERAVREHPQDGRAFLLRARVRAALHRFAAAREDLDAALKLGADARYVADVRSGIEAALGDPAKALALLESSPGREDSESLGTRAALMGELGEVAKAERMFGRAQHSLRDTSPFPLAWLYFQEGLMWERAGNLERARERFEAARARLPQYAPATGHLAGVFAAKHEDAKAIALLAPLAATAEDPEYAGQLAGLLESTATSSAAALRARTSERFDALMIKHPEAFADHAARFWLGAGRDPAKASAAAQKNLEARGTEEALMLALQAAIAAHDRGAACRLADRAKTAREDARHIRALAELAQETCGR